MLARTLFILALTVFLVPSLALAGKETVQVSEEPVVKAWRIPFLTVMGGAGAFFGQDITWATERSAHDINAAGGVRGKPLVIEKYDTKWDLQRTVQEYSRAIKGSFVVLGPITTEMADTIAPLATKYQVPTLAQWSTEAVAYENSPWFSVLASSWMRGFYEITAKWPELHPDIKKVVSFVNSESGYHYYGMQMSEKALTDMGVEIVERIEVPLDAVNLAPAAIKALNANADGYLFHMTPETNSKLLIEMLSRRDIERYRLLVGGFIVSDPFFKLMGDTDIEGIYMLDAYDPNYPGEKWQSFITNYRKITGRLLPTNGVTGHYDMVQIVAKAIEDLKLTGDPDKLKEEREKMRDYLQNLKDFEGLQNVWTMHPGGASGYRTYIFRFEDNKLHVVYKAVLD